MSSMPLSFLDDIRTMSREIDVIKNNDNKELARDKLDALLEQESYFFDGSFSSRMRRKIIEDFRGNTVP